MDQRALLPVSYLILPSVGHDSSTLDSSYIFHNDKTTSLKERKGHTAGPQAAGDYFKLKSMFPLASVDLRLCFYFRRQVSVLYRSTASVNHWGIWTDSKLLNCMWYVFFFTPFMPSGSLSGFNKSAATSAKCFFLSKMNANRFQTLFCISLLWGYTLEESYFVLDKFVTLTACFWGVFLVTFTLFCEFVWSKSMGVYFPTQILHRVQVIMWIICIDQQKAVTDLCFIHCYTTEKKSSSCIPASGTFSDFLQKI